MEKGVYFAYILKNLGNVGFAPRSLMLYFSRFKLQMDLGAYTINKQIFAKTCHSIQGKGFLFVKQKLYFGSLTMFSFYNPGTLSG